MLTPTVSTSFDFHYLVNRLRSLAVFKRGNRDNKPQSREEPGRETTEKLPARMAGIIC